ncbi:3-isopropylmalate dehydratase small subunit [Alteriqipengyuania sp. WL0013]|uniref:3-isopropylmalate dehydratase small subunit n=1 Tax=Alteriqipengyuania sp. WL0013 TaxID=3110773 RepID=UPI002BD26D3C|nr:3-isopropylmalate dehydratase small subunit [Alteriqipengyuania sp. WL0013]MEB3414893.1 3-isopropylmalate dehydratase small subunit [Alteriqipengyuania sp. WL0013]
MQPEPFTTLTAKTLVVRQENVDTDQIIPARFLTTTSRNGLGKAAFYDWRYTADGSAKNTSPFPVSGAGERQVLVAGRNFGCGSSREHAPWALLDYGFRAVISSDIADIFTSNALKNGLLPVQVPSDVHEWLLANPGAEVTLDLEAGELRLPEGRTVAFHTEAFARHCLLNGVDPLGHLLAHDGEIAAYEAAT